MSVNRKPSSCVFSIMALIWVPCLLLLTSVPALGVTFYEDTYIGPGDTTYDNEDIIVDGCTVTIDGHHPFNSLQVINAGTVTHSAAPNGEPDNRLNLTIAQDVFVDATSRIDVTGKGYGAQTGPGAGSTGGTPYGSGAGYGGEGGQNLYGVPGGSAYGSVTQPADLGSGGGYYSGGAGGGAIRLTVNGTLTVEGQVSADGNNGGSQSGGGSGGSIYLTLGTLSGAGVISANGGASGHSYAGGGGGGRIAIEYTANTFAGDLSAYGGAYGFQSGGAGTIYTKSPGQTWGDLLIDNCGNSGALTPSIGADTFDEVTVGDQAKLDLSGTDILTAEQLTVADGGHVYLQTAASFGNVHVQSGGELGHHGAQTGFDLTVTGDVTVDAGGAISADGKGYPAETGPGAGSTGGTPYGSGAGYGGQGGQNYAGVPGGSAYGSITQPTDLGSGGGGSNGGSGGGAIRLTMNGTLAIEGQLSANGNNGGSIAGGGSGGSVYLTVGTLSGAGVISADGGASGHTYTGGGGAGRIAIYYDMDSFTGAKSACAGSGHEYGGAGTIYSKSSLQTWGDLLIDNCGNAGALTPSIAADTFDQVAVANQGKLDLSGTDILTGEQLTVADGGHVYLQTAASFGNVHVQSGGELGHHAAQVGFDLTVTGEATVDAGGAITPDGKGHPAETGPGAGSSGGTSYGSGAGYGGEGGQNCYGTAGGVTYGSAEKPVYLGSGGGHSTGGSGGGAIRLTVNGTLTIEGQVSANGSDAGSNGGGGSGGSLSLHVGTLDGTGLLAAGGGDSGHSNAGGGGGGRIAVYSCSVLMPLEQITATGGAGWENGEDGTIVFGSGTVEILVHPIDQRAYEGDPVTFFVVAAGDGELSYQWRKNGEDLVPEQA